ncbi:hypothetical protein AURDEDRAFT_109870 [Auricularia subglabra TFB-10046 SS5]|nr:hypothetical protein AURDEDRAFT_109870 [Auricularia subglabra TFB-10046 SS5]
MRAQALLKDMQTSGPKPDLFTHNAFLLYYARTGDVPGAAGRLRLIAQDGLTPDTASFTIVLQALLRAEHPNASKVVLDLMRAFGVVPETPVYATMLGAILGLPGEAHITEALSVLDEMARSERARPDERTYSVMLAGLFRQRGLSPERTREIERELQRRMLRARINLSQLSYNHIVCACLEPAAQPSQLMLDTGLRYYHEMIRHGALPNNKAWMLVLSTLTSGAKRDLGEALEVIRTMQERNVSGDPPLRKLVERVQREVDEVNARPRYL